MYGHAKGVDFDDLVQGFRHLHLLYKTGVIAKTSDNIFVINWGGDHSTSR